MLGIFVGFVGFVGKEVGLLYNGKFDRGIGSWNIGKENEKSSIKVFRFLSRK